jgi:hypothetical protein
MRYFGHLVRIPEIFAVVNTTKIWDKTAAVVQKTVHFGRFRGYIPKKGPVFTDF